MLKKFGQILIAVRDYDEALDFYVNKLGFKKIDDKQLAPGIRSISIAPSAESETVAVLYKAKDAEDEAKIGKQFTGMWLNLITDNMDETYRFMKGNGVEFVEEPNEAPWGKQAVIKDLYGNLFDLVEPYQ